MLHYRYESNNEATLFTLFYYRQSINRSPHFCVIATFVKLVKCPGCTYMILANSRYISTATLPLTQIVTLHSVLFMNCDYDMYTPLIEKTRQCITKSVIDTMLTIHKFSSHAACVDDRMRKHPIEWQEIVFSQSSCTYLPPDSDRCSITSHWNAYKGVKGYFEVNFLYIKVCGSSQAEKYLHSKSIFRHTDHTLPTSYKNISKIEWK